VKTDLLGVQLAFEDHELMTQCQDLGVVPRPGSDVSPDDIMDSLSVRLAKYKLPKSVVLVDTLPRNATGKILKARLRSQYGSAPARGTEEA
jgi:fatty-acyl-CoA synthase